MTVEIQQNEQRLRACITTTQNNIQKSLGTLSSSYKIPPFENEFISKGHRYCNDPCLSGTQVVIDNGKVSITFDGLRSVQHLGYNDSDGGANTTREYSVQCTFSVQCTYSVHCTMYIKCTMYIQCTMYVQCTMYNVQSILYNKYIIQYTCI